MSRGFTKVGHEIDKKVPLQNLCVELEKQFMHRFSPFLGLSKCKVRMKPQNLERFGLANS